MNEDDAVREFLGERPAADELSDWRQTLEHRLHALQADLKKAGPEGSPSLQGKIAQLQRQIGALSQEEAVTRFVEDSVRATLAMGAVYQGADDAED